jgi:multiple sugar transport system permease protein
MRWRRSIRPRRADPLGLVLLVPAGVVLLVLSVGPVAYAFYLGFTNVDLVGPTAQHFSFTPGTNLDSLWHDSLFWKALWLTGVFVAASAIAGVTIVGMALAVLMRRAARIVRLIVGAVVVAAWILPAVTSATLWFAFTTQGGTLSSLVGGRADPLDSAPMLIIILANIWTTAGLAMLVLAGGLRGVPDEVLEAAALEGASVWRTFRSVTLPLMRTSIVTTILLVSLLSLANFSLLYSITEGGPGNATNILPVYSYQEAFTFNRLAYGALIGDVMVVVGSVLAYIYVKMSSRSQLRPAEL